MVSMLFLGYLGELELAGGSLAIGFANITGYSVLSGLAMGMEPICGQAFGAKQRKLLGLTLQRTVLLLLAASLPIAFLWINIRWILTWCGQDAEIVSTAGDFIALAVPDLLFLSLLHPLRIYLRTQSITLPITCSSAISVALHVPLNYALVVRLRMGIAGVAAAMVLTDLNLCLCLLGYVLASGVYRDSWVCPSVDCLRGWSTLVRLAVPTCTSVCLEWWWYELMIVLCGLLVNPRATVAAMGILIQTTSLVYLGAGRPARARAAAVVSLGCSAVMGLLAMSFTMAVRHRWGRLFTADEEILELTAAALPIAGLCELGNCPRPPAAGSCGLLLSGGHAGGGAAGVPRRHGILGLWLGLLAAQASCAALMACAIVRTDWAAEVVRARRLTTADDQEVATVGEKKATDLEEIFFCGGPPEEKTQLERDPLISSPSPN
ncbi:unnamed protein product [Spirodela intermedia]|uniref:Uncharacterized protein n=1 Tax=Spirodela intermedia TaxID=51605 RepID=A0A7I8I9A1_SPIIN|nr:unnamed protein product [Spirodela intermedia]CAA6653501.1 unnamed protein product [Spirodela intermedia]